MIYCVIPRELEGELLERMTEYYRGNPEVEVIIDRRDGGSNDRRHGEVDHVVPAQDGTGLGRQDGAAAEGEHPRVGGQRLGHGGAFQGPEMGLAVVDEDLRDRFAGRRLDVVVDVAELHAQGVGDQVADGGLAGPGWPDQHTHRPYGRRRGRYRRAGLCGGHRITRFCR